MLFITPEQHYYNRSYAAPSMRDQLNELCLLDNMQREYCYRQHQIQKRQIQKLNQPEVEYTEDDNNYFIILSKNVNRMNHQYINKFNGYELRQIKDFLIIKSTRDNFFKNITLPSDADLNRDITYRLTNNGYKMTVCISKEQIQQYNHEQYLPDIISQFLGALQSDVEKQPTQCTKQLCTDRIRIPITFDDNNEQDTYVPTKMQNPRYITFQQLPTRQQQTNPVEKPMTQKKTQPKTSQQTQPVTNTQPQKPKSPTQPMLNQMPMNRTQEQPQYNAEDILQSLVGSFQEAMNSIQTPEKPTNPQKSSTEAKTSGKTTKRVIVEHTPANPLKNYNTSGRKTVFLPDTVQDETIEADDESMNDVSDTDYQSDTDFIPVRRTMSPTLEDVVDKEFL